MSSRSRLWKTQQNNKENIGTKKNQKEKKRKTMKNTGATKAEETEAKHK